MELIMIDSECAHAFHSLIREDAYPFLITGEMLALGLVDDETQEAVGAVLFSMDDEEGEAELRSICVAAPYRRQGWGTELMASAADFFAEMTDVNRFVCDFTENEGDDSFRKFLDYLEFEVQESGSACYRTSSKKLSKIKVLQTEARHVTPYRDLTQTQKKLLYGERMDLKPFIDDNLVDENLSCVRLRDGKLAACLIFVRDYQGGNLVLQWANNPGGIPADLLRVFRYAASEAKRYPNEIPIYVPAMNGRSEHLSALLLKGISEKTEQGYRAELNLFGEA
ncbi:MAG: GNAT family N-acetyltransferase [Lachnospiraceae bacterium]|nr:GNAT family N-acetyltransferase [Lachnospiraceae bacterium]